MVGTRRGRGSRQKGAEATPSRFIARTEYISYRYGGGFMADDCVPFDDELSSDPEDPCKTLLAN
jgi:hypothetical protein